MLPKKIEIARQIAVLVKLHPDWTTSKVAQELGYSPLLTINAIAECREIGYVTEDKKKDMLTLVFAPILVDLGPEGLGDINKRLCGEILTLLTRLNSNLDDISIDQLKFWMIGFPESAFEMALYALETCGDIYRYTLRDPKDIKSKYEFITLICNCDKKWGEKQFKLFTKKKKK